MNFIGLSGVVVRDPELRFVAGSGKAVCKFTLAVKKAFKPKDGPDADFHECQLWGKQAESFAEYNVKGSRVAVTGELNDNNYEDKDGKTQYRKIVNCNHWEFNGNKQENSKPSEQHEQQLGDLNSEGFQSIEDDLDVPF